MTCCKCHRVEHKQSSRMLVRQKSCMQDGTDTSSAHSTSRAPSSRRQSMVGFEERSSSSCECARKLCARWSRLCLMISCCAQTPKLTMSRVIAIGTESSKRPVDLFHLPDLPCVIRSLLPGLLCVSWCVKNHACKTGWKRAQSVSVLHRVDEDPFRQPGTDYLQRLRGGRLNHCRSRTRCHHQLMKC